MVNQNHRELQTGPCGGQPEISDVRAHAVQEFSSSQQVCFSSVDILKALTLASPLDAIEQRRDTTDGGVRTMCGVKWSRRHI